MPNSQDSAQAAATAAQQVANAAASAAAAVATAAAQANVAMATDISWMKKSLVGIEIALKEISGVYYTQKEFAEHLKVHEDLEERLRKTIEQSQQTQTQLKTWGIAFSVLVTTVQIILRFI